MFFPSLITTGLMMSVLVRSLKITTGGRSVIVNRARHKLAYFSAESCAFRVMFIFGALHRAILSRAFFPKILRNRVRIVFFFRFSPIERNPVRRTTSSALLAGMCRHSRLVRRWQLLTIPLDHSTNHIVGR